MWDIFFQFAIYKFQFFTCNECLDLWAEKEKRIDEKAGSFSINYGWLINWLKNSRLEKKKGVIAK